MKSKLHWLTSVGLLVAALAHAQSPQDGAQNQSAEPQRRTQVLAPIAAGPQQSSNSQKMYEDIEIMRRIVNRKLGLWPGLIASNTNCAVCHNLSATHMGGDPAMLRRLSLDLLGTLPEPNSAGGGDLNQNVVDVFLAKDHQGYESAHTSLAVPTNVE